MTFDHRAPARDWSEQACFCSDVDLLKACAADANDADLSDIDISKFFPPPSNLREIQRIKDPVLRKHWMKAHYKEVKVLIDSQTFILGDTPGPNEPVTPTMETNRVKLGSDGRLDKLKVRIVVRGDLQNKTLTEDKWSPTASFRAMKMFLADASRHKARVRQLDFIGAFLQAKVRSRVFIRMPASYGEIWPEFKPYCGIPVRLAKSMYGMTLSGKNWYVELQEWLLSEGFQQSSVIKCFFWKTFPDGSVIKMLDYVDDLLYFGTSLDALKAFEEAIGKRFDLTLMGQAHWYLATRISQAANFNITVDQSRYCTSVVKRYLEKAGCKNVTRFHNTPLPSDFVPTADDNSKDDETAAKLQEEYNIDFASCIGSLIYLALTRTDIIYAVNKLAKFTRQPGEKHMLALVHLLRYLRDNTFLGLCFYSDFTTSPVYCLLKKNNLPLESLFFTFSDSSWNDDVDHGRSTGCFLIFYMGGVVDHSSNLPDPVALSSAESEYNQCCVAGMATTHLKMFLNELELKDCNDFSSPVSIFLDNNSAIAIGTSFKDTKHTRHILRRYHYVRENVDAGRFALHWILSAGQLADIGTKPLGGPTLEVLMKYLFVIVPQELVQEG